MGGDGVTMFFVFAHGINHQTMKLFKDIDKNIYIYIYTISIYIYYIYLFPNKLGPYLGDRRFQFLRGERRFTVKM